MFFLYMRVWVTDWRAGHSRPQVSIIIQEHTVAPRCHCNGILENLKTTGLHGFAHIAICLQPG